MVAYPGMTIPKLEAALRQSFPGLQDHDGFWIAEVEDLELYVVPDEANDRIRIMIPVARAERSDTDLLWVLLVANYQLSLDARYAVHDGVVWCTFLHRLSWLTEPELDNALCNVLTLARNTGGTFSSSDLVLDEG